MVARNSAMIRTGEPTSCQAIRVALRFSGKCIICSVPRFANCVPTIMLRVFNQTSERTLHYLRTSLQKLPDPGASVSVPVRKKEPDCRSGGCGKLRPFHFVFLAYLLAT